MKAAEIEGKRFWCLDGNTSGFGQGESLAQGREGGARIAEAMQEDQNVRGGLRRGRWIRQWVLELARIHDESFAGSLRRVILRVIDEGKSSFMGNRPGIMQVEY